MESVLTQLLVEGDRVMIVGPARRPIEAAGVGVTIVADASLASVGVAMGRGEVDRVFVTTDRVRANGDFAAAVGTYALAVLSKFHGVPLFVLEGEASGDEVVPESLVTAWVRGHEIIARSRSGNIPPT